MVNIIFALTLNKLGLAELAQGEFDMAMHYFQEALRVCQTHLAPNEINPIYHKHLST